MLKFVKRKYKEYKNKKRINATYDLFVHKADETAFETPIVLTNGELVVLAALDDLNDDPNVIHELVEYVEKTTGITRQRIARTWFRELPSEDGHWIETSFQSFQDNQDAQMKYLGED